jgi:hypothetical protein
MEQKPGQQQKERIAKFSPWKMNFESNFKQNKEGQDKKY